MATTDSSKRPDASTEEALRARIATLEEEVREWEALAVGERASYEEDLSAATDEAVARARKRLEGELDRRVEAAVAAQSAAVDERSRRLAKQEQDLVDRAARLDERAEAVGAQEKRLAKEQKYFARDKENLDARESQISARDARSLAAKAEAEQQVREASKRMGAVEEREWALKAREADVEAGLPARAEAVRASLEEAFRALRQGRADFDAERAGWTASREEAVAAEQDRLRAESERLRDLRAQLEQDRALYDEDVADLQVERASFEAVVDRHAGDRVAKLGVRVEHLERDLAAMTETAEEYHEQLRALRATEVRTAGRSVEEMDREVERLRRENDALQSALDARPSPEDGARLRRLEREREAWSRERDEVQGRLAEAESAQSLTEAERLRLGSAETVAAMHRNEAEILKARLADLNRALGRGDLQASAFPRLLGVDAERSLWDEPVVEHLGGSDRLAPLVAAVRGDLGRRRLHYAPETLRLYLAGLAMSRLVLLEGMPGTGKTTLARAFADSVGAGAAKVEVQAGWRDKQDLLGHYNTFERQFSETPFLEALYRARTPAHVDRPFFIVLDEMNLSRPEYYFADFLSLLEDREGEPVVRVPRGAVDAVSVSLMNKPLGAGGDGGAGDVTLTLPHGLRESRGMTLGIPDNVWFITTANQDESTLQPAPKTYARAHVQVLPPAPAEVAPAVDSPFSFGVKPLGFKGLYSAFKDAERRKAADVQWAEDTLEQLKVPLAEQDVAWSNRLLRQARPFVAVYVAAGGTKEAALDHLLATKVLGSLEGRFGLTRSEIGKVRDTIGLVADEGTGAPAPFPAAHAVLTRLEKHSSR